MIDVQIEQGVATLRMAHGKVNAMNLELLEQFNRQLDTLAADDDISTLIIAGNDRVFSAGVDLKRLVDEPPAYLDRFLPELTGMFRKVFRFPKPVIAAITGHAVAGGCVLACAADYRVISSRARIGVPELRVGVPFPSSGMEIMRWAANAPVFRKMINTGATFTGGDAVTAGLADECVEPGKVVEQAVQAKEPFSVVPPAVFRLTKRQMRQPVEDRIERGTELFGDEIENLWRASETLHAVREYVDQRLR